MQLVSQALMKIAMMMDVFVSLCYCDATWRDRDACDPTPLECAAAVVRIRGWFHDVGKRSISESLHTITTAI